MHDADEGFDVAGMEADGGFVEDEESLRKAGAETGGEVDAGDFATTQGACRSVEGEVGEPNLLEV